MHGGLPQPVPAVLGREAAGDIIEVGDDGVSALGCLAARTRRMDLASGVMQLYTRTPTLTAMTAAGLDHVSGGRFNLGLGASGPQVIEGFHGVRHDALMDRHARSSPSIRVAWAPGAATSPTTWSGATGTPTRPPGSRIGAWPTVHIVGPCPRD